MRCGKYVFTCAFLDDAILPEYKGSTFRGVLGHALKKVACALRREDCGDCLLQSRCVYALVFEKPPPSGTTTERTRIVAPPHPYVIEPSPTAQTRYRTGETFEFSLLLFGEANDYLPYFIFAFDQIGQTGIGKRIDGKRGNFSLKTVEAVNRIVYDAGLGKLNEGTFTTDLAVLSVTPGDPCSVGAETTLEINILTPLRLKYDNHLEATLPFHILIRAALRRVSSLCAHYGGGEPDLDYRGLVARARDVQTVSSSLRWFDWRRYSNRQDQDMLMGGMIGRIVYAGALDEYLPLLKFCEQVHLGKQTTFGLGKIAIARNRQQEKT
jgi:hypothetical protein